jgi:hypothetical protein
MVTFIIYAVGLRILWEMAKWNTNMLRKIESHTVLGVCVGLSLIGWILLALFILQNQR